MTKPAPSFFANLYARVPDAIDHVLMSTATSLANVLSKKTQTEILKTSNLCVCVNGRNPTIDYYLQKMTGSETLEQCAEDDTPIDLTISSDQSGSLGWRVPAAVGTCVALPNSDEKPPWQSKSNKNNLSRIRNNGLTYSVSHDPLDFARFYHDMYVPYMAGRYGELGQLRSEHRMLRQFYRGGLLWILHEGKQIAASMFSTDQTTLRSWILAPDPAYENVIALGGLVATYLFMMQYAIDQNMTHVNLGPCRAMLNDGVLQHKKHWGAVVRNEPDVKDELIFQWDPFTPAIARFLHDCPLIVRDGNDFSGLCAMPMDGDPDPDQTRAYLKIINMHGLKRIHVIADESRRTDMADVINTPIIWRDPDQSFET